jgi:hypothetical protein
MLPWGIGIFSLFFYTKGDQIKKELPIPGLLHTVG